MGSSMQEYWSGLPCPSPGDLPNPGIEPGSLMFPALTGGFFTPNITWEAYSIASTNSLIFTLYGMARQSIISSVLDISHYNTWSKKEVWLLDISSNVSATTLNQTPLDKFPLLFTLACQVAQVVNNLPTNAGDIRDPGSIPGLGRSPRGGHDTPLQHSCLGNSIDRGAWQAIVPRVAKSQTRLKQRSMHTRIYMYNWITLLYSRS